MVLHAAVEKTVGAYYVLQMLYPSKFSNSNQKQFHYFSLATLLISYNLATLY